MSDTTETATTAAVLPEAELQYLIGIRLREPLQAEDYLTTDVDLHVGDVVAVETGQGTGIGEVRRPKRLLPDFKRDRLYRHVLRRASDGEIREWRDRRALELEHAETCRRRARGRGLQLKVVYVEIDPQGTVALQQQWSEWGNGARLVVLNSPFRSLLEPLLEYIEQLQQQDPHGYVTVILPEFVPHQLWQHLLHNQHALLIKGALLFKPNVVVTSVPFHLGRQAKRVVESPATDQTVTAAGRIS